MILSFVTENNDFFIWGLFCSTEILIYGLIAEQNVKFSLLKYYTDIDIQNRRI